jgi:hypothetical protein
LFENQCFKRETPFGAPQTIDLRRRNFSEKSPISPSSAYFMTNFFSRRTTRLAALSLLIAAAFLWIFIVPRNPGPYRALPAQTSVVVEFHGLLAASQIVAKNDDPIWKPVLQTALFRTAWQDAAEAQRLFAHDPALRRAFAQAKMLAGCSLHPADSLHALFALEAPDAPLLSKLLENNKLSTKFFPHKFRGHTLYTVHLPKNRPLVVAREGDLLLFSFAPVLVEDALAQLGRSTNWWADRKHIGDLPAAPLRLHARPSALAAQWSSPMLPAWRNLPALLARNVEWLGLAWDGQNVQTMAEYKGFLSEMASWGTSPRGAIFSVLPDNTALLAWAGFADAPRFFNALSKGQMTDFERFVRPWVGSEAACAVTEPLSPALQDDRLLLLAVRDSAEALAQLRAYAALRGALPQENYQMFEVLGFQSSAILQPLVGDDVAFRNPVCALAGRYAVFAPNRSALEVFLDKYLVNQTLANNTDFLQLQQKLPSKGCALLLLNATYLPGLLKGLFAPDAPAPSAADLRAFVQTGFVAADFQPSFGRRVDIQLAAQRQSEPPPATNILWKTPLAAQASTQPFVIESPIGEASILVQDAQNRLACLGPNGGVRWTRQLTAPLISAVQGIDFFANGTPCYLFNTAREICLLDENGKDVEGFPLRLQSPATNGVTAVDFDKNLKFNYFVACANGNVYGFDQFGRALPGWNPQSDLGRVEHPLLHFQRAGKDYLAVLARTGQLSVFGRDGALRFRPAQFGGGAFPSPPQADAASKSPRILCLNATGEAFACNLEGAAFSLLAGQKTNRARGLFAPISGDPRFECVVAAGERLSMSGYTGGAFETIFSLRMPAPQDTVFALSGNRIGTWSRSKRQVFLLNAAGELGAGFPLAGTTPFALTRSPGSGQEMLVVGNGSNVYAYKVR